MKICHIIIDLDIGGAEFALKRLVTDHKKKHQGHHVIISLTRLGKIGEELMMADFKIFTLGMKNIFYSPIVFFKLTRLLIKIKPDIVQTWMYHSDLFGGIAARLAGVRNVIWGIRSTDISESGNRLTLLIRRICAILSYYIPDVIVCVANSSKLAHKSLGYASNKLLVIFNGIDIDRFSSEKYSSDNFRLKIGILPSDRVIGSIGRFSPEKNHSLFIEAAARLLISHANLKFLLVGRGLDKQNRSLMSMINKTKNPQAFILLGERSDIPACLMSMNIFCLHSTTEGFPNALAEAMALGLACVTTDVGDAAFLLNGHGLVVHSKDSVALANALDEMLDKDLVTLNEMHLMVKSRIISDFSMQAMTDQFHKLYTTLINH